MKTEYPDLVGERRHHPQASLPCNHASSRIQCNPSVNQCTKARSDIQQSRKDICERF